MKYKSTFCKGCGSLLKNKKEKCPNCKSIKKYKKIKAEKRDLMRILTIILLLIIPCNAFADRLIDERLDDAVIMVESAGNPTAVSFRGAKYGRGLMQISEIVLDEYNNTGERYHKTKWDLFCPEINTHIGDWYLNERIPQMLKYFKIKDTLENRLWAYNAGIGNVIKNRKPKETIDYIKKVMKLYERR